VGNNEWKPYEATGDWKNNGLVKFGENPGKKNGSVGFGRIPFGKCCPKDQ